MQNLLLAVTCELVVTQDIVRRGLNLAIPIKLQLMLFFQGFYFDVDTYTIPK